MGAMQAQDYGQSLWAIGCRLRRPSLAAVEAAISAGFIVRTWPMRGTIHWVPAVDAAWMVALSGERTLASARTRLRQLALDDEIIGRARSVLVDELRGGQRLSRPAVMKLWESVGIVVDGQRGYHLLWHLAHLGQIVIGPMDGKQQTFALLDEWAPNPRRLTRQEGLAELATRYVESHGPVTAHDFAWWAGITVTDARIGLGSTGLPSDRVGQREMWSADVSAARPGGVELLAGFDEFLLGYQQRSDVLDAEFFDRVVPGNNGIFQPCVVADGRLVGVWKRKVRKGFVDIAVSLFEPGSLSIDDLSATANRFAEFIGVPLGEFTVLP